MEQNENDNSRGRNGIERQTEFIGTHDKSLDKSSLSDSDLTLWERSPPVAEISRKTLAEHEKKDKTTCNIHYYGSVCAVVVAIVIVWLLFLVPQLCYFKVGVCTSQLNQQKVFGYINIYIYILGLGDITIFSHDTIFSYCHLSNYQCNSYRDICCACA